jgi:hypothetical protein
MADETDGGAFIEAMEPREQLIVYWGYIRAFNDVIEILSDQAEDADEDGRELIRGILDEIRPLVEDAAHQQERLKGVIQREAK